MIRSASSLVFDPSVHSLDTYELENSADSLSANSEDGMKQ